MLNISRTSIKDRINIHDYQSLRKVQPKNLRNKPIRILVISGILSIIVLFLPWTQNIKSSGFVTTLHPEQRPQNINSIIGGRIEKWYFREGSQVKKGDTLLFISEIKEEYLDPDLIDNTARQISSREQSVDAYMNKIKSLDTQIDSLLKTKILKIKQANNYLQQTILKVKTDSITLDTEIKNNQISKSQLDRFEKLYKDGLKSLTELESKKAKYLESEASLALAEAKFFSSKNELLNLKMELISIENQFTDKIAKAESEKQAALSNLYETEGIVTKMQNQLVNYNVRNKMYFILSP